MELLKGQRALVTGGGVNIGRSIALSLAKAGADVAILYNHSGERAASTVVKIKSLGRRSLAFKADISQEGDVKSVFSSLSEAWGGLDILVNNAGILSLHAQDELPIAEWDRMWSINMGGLFLCSREALNLMDGGGAVVNIASINAFHPGFGNTAHYDASKGAVVAYTRSLAVEWAPRGIRVNAVAPGLVDSEQLRSGAPELVDSVTARTPLGSLIKPEDVADTVIYLASPLASQVTGQTIIVDGGYLLT